MERNPSIFTITLLFLYCLIHPFILAAIDNKITTDQDALLALKAQVTDDPTDFLAKNWNTTKSVCNWIGVTCDMIQHRITVLNISGFNLAGTIPLQLGNLSSLQILDLSYNRFSGTIPSSIFNMSSLQTLGFHYNNLSGELPENICSSFPYLTSLHLSRNMFYGKIPSTLSKCKQLQYLWLSTNHLSGAIPREIGNLTKLKYLHLGYNTLQGEIPHEIGNLHNLESLILAYNNLSGVVSTTIFNMSAVKVLYLQNNTLTGKLPSSKGLGLPNVEELLLSFNNFGGTIPNFIFNASKLRILEMAANSLSGFIPNTFDNLRNLEQLELFINYLTSSTPELSFLSSLSNSKNLKIISFAGNPLNAILPSSVGNLSTSLEEIYIGDCNISGSIPKEIENLNNLTLLSFWGNELNRLIPISLNRLQRLQSLDLSNNKLEGSIPDDLCHLPALYELYLESNKLSGSIPACLDNLSTLRKLDLNSNGLTSNIPSTFWNLKDILYVDFSSNSLTGPLPSKIETLKVLIELNLSKNLFSGDIPTTITSLKDLQFLSLGYNQLTGSIPESFGDLINLKSLDLSNNNLSGVIPKSMEKLLYLEYLNLSFNRLEGEIPSGGPFTKFTAESFIRDDLLCGSPSLQVPPCQSNNTRTHHRSKKNTLLLGIVLPLSTAFILVLIFVLMPRCQKRNTELPNNSNISPHTTHRRISYLELLRATDEFSESNLIGMGSFGSVYKARFQDGVEVAIKVFHLQFERAFKSFEAECEVMKSLRHRNLVKIISSCSNDDFKALVLEYMPNGSLEECLYSSNCILDIFQRMNIMIDVASALEYLHFGYSIPVIHCDLKPSNVLLDENMVAHLSDFGIAKLLSGEDQSFTQTQTLATIGYMAPEYGREGQISTRGDVYSYGIMLMEIFTSKKPTDELFAGEMSLKSWVSDLLHSSTIEHMDTNLLSREDQHFAAKEQCVLSIFNLAIECTTKSPKERIGTKEIAPKLCKIRDTLLRNIQG